jgi:hypothetical protein
MRANKKQEATERKIEERGLRSRGLQEWGALNLIPNHVGISISPPSKSTSHHLPRPLLRTVPDALGFSFLPAVDTDVDRLKERKEQKSHLP